jgi:hypothetical protein
MPFRELYVRVEKAVRVMSDSHRLMIDKKNENCEKGEKMKLIKSVSRK